MFKTKHATTTLPALTHGLSNIDFHQIAIQTGLIKRVTRGFTAEGFFLSLMKAVASGDASFRKLASNLAESVQVKSLSKQALHYRASENAINFLKTISTQLLNTPLTSKNRGFNRVLLQDSSQLRLAPKNSEYYTGTSNQWGPKSSAKLDLIKDLLTGEIIDLNIGHGTESDRVLGEDVLAHIEPKDLVLRDMGYFSTTVFKKIEQDGAYWISRLPANTHIYLPDGEALEPHLKAQPPELTHLDLEVQVTQKQQHPSRLVAIRCSEEVTNQRRRKAKAHREKMKSQANKLSLQREGWTLYLTNLPKEQYSAQQIHEIYTLRWNIEIQFRALKGQANIRGLLGRVCKNKTQLDVLLQALMIYAQLTAKTYVSLAKQHSKVKNRLSIELIASWLEKAILTTSNLHNSIITYDLRHLTSDGRRSRITQSQLAKSLF